MDRVFVNDPIRILPERFAAVSANKVSLSKVHNFNVSDESCFAAEDLTTSLAGVSEHVVTCWENRNCIISRMNCVLPQSFSTIEIYIFILSTTIVVMKFNGILISYNRS